MSANGTREGRNRLIQSAPASFKGLIIGTALLIALGGGTHPLSLSLVAIVLGAAMLRRAPTHGIDRLTSLSAFTLFTYILIATWLPASSTEWRRTADQLGIEIAHTITPQPWVSVEALIAFVVGYALFAFAVANRPNPEQWERSAKLLAGALLALAVGSITATRLGLRLPWADGVHVFSWFPNRNQSALVFACGSLLAFGLAFLPWHPDKRNASPSSRAPTDNPWIITALWCVIGSALLYAVFLSLSKGALIAWGFGMLVLVTVLPFKSEYSRVRLLKLLPTLAILLFAFFVFFGGKSRERLINFVTSPISVTNDGADVPIDFRWQIYTETASLISDQPWTGVGLGQFQYVFPQYRTLPSAPVAIRHPESDLLWWTAELGIIGLSLITCFLGSLLFRLCKIHESDKSGLDTHNNSAFSFHRFITLAALVPVFVHGFVDVGGHRIGTVALAILLYALALPVSESYLRKDRDRHLWRFSGAIILLIGLGMLTLTAMKSPLLGAYATSASEPLSSRPLQWQPHFRHAVQTYSGNRQAALDSFERARFLKIDNAAIPLEEGLFLFKRRDFRPAFAAFEDAIVNSTEATELFSQILRKTGHNPSIRERLEQLSRTNGELLAAYWTTIPLRNKAPEAVAPRLQEDWSRLSDDVQIQILYRLNNYKLTTVTRALYEASAPNEQKRIWPAAARALVAEGEWNAALDLINEWGQPKPLPAPATTDQTLKQLQANTIRRPDDPVAATQLLNAYLSRQMWDDARRTALKLKEIPKYPPDTEYWLGFLLEKTGQNEAAARAYVEWLSNN